MEFNEFCIFQNCCIIIYIVMVFEEKNRTCFKSICQKVVFLKFY